MIYTTSTLHPIFCSECGGRIAKDDKYELLPFGTVFALKRDGFKENRAFCGDTEFKTFYSKNMDEDCKKS